MRDDVARMEPAVGATAPGRWRNPGTKCSEGPGFRKGFIRAMGLSNALSASSLRTQGPIATGVNWMKIASSIASYRGHNAVWVPDRRSLALTCPGRHGLGFRFNCQTSRGYASSFSRRHASELCFDLTPSKERGRREDRMRAAPAVSCAKCTSKNAHEHTGPAENTRPSLRSGFYRLITCSPR